MKGDLVTKILLVIVLLLLVFNLIKSKGSENVAWGESSRTVVAGAVYSMDFGEGRTTIPVIYRFWSDGTIDVAVVDLRLASYKEQDRPRRQHPSRSRPAPQIFYDELDGGTKTPWLELKGR